jgi:4-hydroxy-tetrahydrodipicolinate synthase
MEAMRSGAHGGVCGGANLFPALYVGLYRACQAGDAARAAQLHATVIRVSEALYHVGRHPSAFIKGVKCALSCLGICDDFMAEPFHRFRAAERALVEERLPALQAEMAGLGL